MCLCVPCSAVSFCLMCAVQQSCFPGCNTRSSLFCTPVCVCVYAYATPYSQLLRQKERQRGNEKGGGFRALCRQQQLHRLQSVREAERDWFELENRVSANQAEHERQAWHSEHIPPREQAAANIISNKKSHHMHTQRERKIRIVLLSCISPSPSNGTHHYAITRVLLPSSLSSWAFASAG